LSARHAKSVQPGTSSADRHHRSAGVRWWKSCPL